GEHRTSLNGAALECAPAALSLHLDLECAANRRLAPGTHDATSASLSHEREAPGTERRLALAVAEVRGECDPRLQVPAPRSPVVGAVASLQADHHARALLPQDVHGLLEPARVLL